MLISERIYKYMEEKGISQLEFAKKTGISQSTVSDWKRKKTNPSADKIMIICEVLGISPYELLQGTDNQKLKVSHSLLPYYQLHLQNTFLYSCSVILLAYYQMRPVLHLI